MYTNCAFNYLKRNINHAGKYLMKLATILNIFNEVHYIVINALLVIQEKLGELVRKAGWPGQATGGMSSFGSTKFTYYRNQIRSKVRANTSWFYVISFRVVSKFLAYTAVL